MEKLDEAQIQQRLSKIEANIKMKNDFSREDIQNSINMLRYKGFSPERKRDILKQMIGRTGVKRIGLKTLYTPRADHSIGEEDKTLKFLDDLYSYRGIKD
jgi:hypothetical protein